MKQKRKGLVSPEKHQKLFHVDTDPNLKAYVTTDCNVFFDLQRNCDIDAHFTMNRLCAGKQTCTLLVSKQFFNDPCGYEEFLSVSYRCVQGKWNGHF